MSSEQAPCGQAEGRAHEDIASRRAAHAAHAALFGEPTVPAPGEIWTLSAPAGPGEHELLLAIVTSVSDQEVAVVPVSVDPDTATEWDLLIPASVLGYRSAAQAKLAGSAGRDQLQERLSSLPAALMGELKQLADAADRQVPIPPANLNVGPWVLSEEDPRLAARKHIADEVSAYITLAYADPAAEWGSFGGILVRSSRAQGTSIETLVDEVWAQAIQEDQVDLFNRVPARRLARLITDLQIAWNERVRQTLKNAVRATLTPSEVVHGAALGRRRGARSRSKQRARASPKEADRAASEYVASVEKALKGQ